MALPGLTAFSGPLDEQQLVDLHAALAPLSKEQMVWVSGYVAGLGAGVSPAASVESEKATSRRLTILYGSQTGNACAVAEALGERALAQGLAARILSTADLRPRDLTKERLLLLVVSTQGEGEPPESALELHGFLGSKRAARLPHLSYAVLGLGDSSYEHFCRAAVDFDQRLAALGAERLAPLTCCDLSYQEAANAWSETLVDKIRAMSREQGAQVIAMPGVCLGAPAKHGKDNPFIATLLENRRITTDDAITDVRHIALRVDPDAVRFKPGDSLGVRFLNDPALVEEILTATGASGDASVSLGGESMGLRRALTERLELTQLHPSLVRAWAEIQGVKPLQALARDAAATRAYADARQLIDLLSDYPGRLDAEVLAGILQPLQPRLYSIASSQAELDDEVHLTVSNLTFDANGRSYRGAASGYLSERLPEDAEVPVYVVENPSFRPPAQRDVPVIMIAAGTGIAPYRAFAQQRVAEGDNGRNWLVFGNRHFGRDFLYQVEWQALRKTGRLDRVSLAFSRDGGDKRYVQHRLQEEGAEVYRWLAEGAHLYVCGSTAMGWAVQEALTDLIARAGVLEREGAEDFVDNLRREGRYQRDLY